jgi:thioesterase domain-containing protein
VEPAEIEFVLKQEPGVEDAAVAPQERAGYPTRLVGFLSAPSPHDGQVVERVRARLAATLPGYMHPAVLIVLESLPFNAHGKIDVARLPMPVSVPDDSSVVAELNPGAATLRALWRDATGAAVVDDGDNFFDCGGDSITLTLLLKNIAVATGIQIPMGVFLQNPAYGYALELLRGKGGLNLPPAVVPLAQGNQQSPLFLVAGAGGGVHGFRELVAEMGLERPVYGLESQALTPPVRANFTIAGAAAEFLKAVCEVQPNGPYLLGGYSLGGLIAMEMAERLRASGQEVQKLVLLDTYAKLPPRNRGLLTFTLAKNLVRMQPAQRRVFLREKMSWLRRNFWNKRKGNAEMKLLDQQKRAEMRAGLDYMANGIRPCEVLIELFTAQDGTMAWNSTRDRGWLDYAIAGVAVREVPGGHYSLLQTPHVRGLAAELNSNFDRHENLMNWRKRHFAAPLG